MTGSPPAHAKADARQLSIIIKMLSAQDPKTRDVAVRALTAIDLERITSLLGDPDLSTEAAAYFARHVGERADWIEALLTNGPEGQVEAAAARLEELGWRRVALDAWADAALLAARAGRSSDAEDRALALARSTGIHPLLGPLPETRWVSARSG